MARSPQQAANPLVLAPAPTTGVEEDVYDILTQSAISETNLLVVSYWQGPDTWIADFQRYIGTLPADLGFIHVGETTRSVTAPTADTTHEPPMQFVDAVSNPTDLTELGIRISQYLERWAGSDAQLCLYIDSLTALLQFVDRERAYRFLHILNGRINSVDGCAYYRLTPGAHDTQTVAVLRNLMDHAIDLTPDSQPSSQ